MMTQNVSYRSNYRILGQIGQGQFGQVYFAIRRQTGELVALKSLGKGFPTNRFLREFSCLVSLRHPNIVSCKAIEYHGKGRYLVMDYCEGGTLRNFMDFSAQLSLASRLDLIIDILAGLEEAHEHNIIHCDIKPENILLSLTAEKWIAKVTDFGIARICQERVNNQLGSGYTGSPAYMAPERFYGKYSYGCDIYSVGIILYELMVGERPFSGLPDALMLAHLNQRILLPDTVPEPLKGIIIKALEKLPQRRFSSAKEMLQAIDSVKKKLNLNQDNNQLFFPVNIGSLNHIISVFNTNNFPEKITHILSNNTSVYLGINNQLIRLLKQNKTEQITFKNPIKSLRLSAQGCLVLTQKEKGENSQYNFYYFPENEPLEKALNRGILTEFHGEKLKFSIDLEGHWLARVSKRNNQEITAQFKVLSIPNLSVIGSHKSCPFPSQLITLDQRHGLAIFPRIAQGEKRTYLYLFNRRGRFIKGFFLPLLISELTANKTNSYELFGVENIQPYYGILIKLNPLKIRRIPLEIIPNFIVAEDWGYGLGETTGKLVLLDREGDYLGKINLGVTITAMTGLNKHQILIATWENGEGKLLIIDITFINDR